jgi:uncharacterized RDD family membrane protein YckC
MKAFKRFLPLIEPLYLTMLVALLLASAAIRAEDTAPDATWSDALVHPIRHHHHDNDLVSIGHGSNLAHGEHADSVVSVFGSSTSDGEAEVVVSVFGNTRVTGPLSDSAVAVLGNTYVDSAVDGDAVAVLGNIELGPNAEIGGNVVAVGGAVKRDPAAIIHGNVRTVAGNFVELGWLQPWIDHCLLYARPLAFVPGIGWAWRLALACLALYIGLALLFRPAVMRCVETIETKPGATILASLLTVLLIPILLVLLCITVIGIAAVPFLMFALLCVGFFGKAVMLAWLGRRCIKHAEGPGSHPAFAVLIGGIIVLALYVVPVVGFVVFKLLGLMGIGVVVYTLVLGAQAHRAARDAGLHSPTPPRAEAAPAAAAAPVAAAAAPAAAAAVPPAAPPPSPAVTAALPHAGFWIRIAALLLDALLIGMLLGVLRHSHNVELVALAVYGAVMWKLRGATLGGTVFDLRVVRLDGRPIEWETAIIRALGCFLSLAVAGLGFFWIAFDQGKQAWHDKIAGTVVVRVTGGL